MFLRSIPLKKLEKMDMTLVPYGYNLWSMVNLLDFNSGKSDYHSYVVRVHKKLEIVIYYLNPTFKVPVMNWTKKDEN